MTRRVVVTGIGCVSALGGNAREFWDACRAGRSGIGPIGGIDMTGIRFSNGAQAREFDASKHFDEKQLVPLDRFAQLAIVAAREAMGQAALGLSAEEKQRAAIVTGSCYGGKASEDAGFHSLYYDRSPRVHPLTIPRLMANAGASALTLELGWQGPVWTVSTACSSANHAIGQAFWLVRHGIADVALAGGSEAPFTYGSMKAWEALRVVSPDTCRPFSKNRAGMVLGEGAAMLVLEPLERAVARGVTVLAEIVGFGMGADAHHITQPSAAGAARVIGLALADGGVAAESVGVVNAHGTGTAVNDVAESSALRTVFGSHLDAMRVTSTKSLHGHALGAAGALEAVATICGLRGQAVAPTANFVEADPETVTPVTSFVPFAHEVAISNSFAFGGLNAVLVMRR
ncbi:MAG: beta-ketoacyl-[acyl-carrier-protein] synthase family protein [Acidobacteria bacterium]|nr:beta-ketoacyl-[acyl-carrier-protein] synthase family protein [Acidobacteriota bacterium]